MKEQKGKLYIHYNSSFKSLKGEHTEVLHAVKESKVKDHIQRRQQLVKKYSFVPTKTNRQMRIHGEHSSFTNLNK